MAATTKEKDMGARFIREQAKNINGKWVKIGINEDVGQYPDGTRIVDVAFWNEFGTKRIPERSFIRAAPEKNKGVINRFIQNGVKQISAQTLTETQALDKLGFMIREMVRTYMEELSEPPNAVLTIKGKPSVGNNPLIRTRLLKRSIDYKIGEN